MIYKILNSFRLIILTQMQTKKKETDGFDSAVVVQMKFVSDEQAGDHKVVIAQHGDD